MQRRATAFSLDKRWLNLLTAGGTLGGLLLVIYLTIRAFSGRLGNDFGQYYETAGYLWERHNPYLDAPNPFILPLWADLPYLWLNFWDHDTALNIWTIFNLPLMGLVVWLAAQLSGFISTWKNFLIVFAPGMVLMQGGWTSGQPTIVIALMLYFSLWLVNREKYFLAGFSGLVFLIIKPQVTILPLLVLLGWCAVQKTRLSFWLGAALAFLTALLITLVLLPSWLQDYLNTFSPTRTGAGDRWLTSTLLDFLRVNFGLEGSILWVIYGGWVLAGLTLLGWLVLQTGQGKLSLVALVTATIALNLVITPYTRDYDYPLLVLPVIFVLVKSLYLPPNRLIGNTRLTLLAGSILYYIITTYMHQLFLLNLTLLVLTAWCCYDLAKSGEDGRMNKK